MHKPETPQTSPYVVRVEKDQTVFWCACGRSQKQPFCDGSHKGTDITPLRFTAEKSEQVYFCGCKHTKTAPRCDGSHKALKM